MHRLQRIFKLSIWFCIAWYTIIFAAELTPIESAKIAPALKLFLPWQKKQFLKSSQEFAITTNSQGEREFDLLVKFQGAAATLNLQGVKVRATIGPIASVVATMPGVYRLAQHPNVTWLELSQYHAPYLDVSRISTGVDKLYAGNPIYRGNGVLVGIFDSGIDWQHEDFIDAQGKSRILFLWDVTDDGGPAPAGFTYGSEYTQAQINDEIDGSPTGLIREKDTNGHGTHVAGIAAGDGSATGNGVEAYTYIGMAPQADLIVVKGGVNGYATTDEVNGLAYLTKKARALGRPMVMNYSIGGHWGAHDGTALTEQAIDAAAAAGQIVVVSASNDGDCPLHASGTVTRNRAVTTKFLVKQDANEVWIDLWHSGNDQMQITVTTPDGFTTPAQASGKLEDWKYWNTNSGRVGVIAPSKNPENQDYEFTIWIDNEGGTAVQTGDWQFELTGVQISNGRFDAWTQYSKVEFTSNIDYERLIAIPATARQAVTVASYCTKNEWASIDGGTYHYTNWPRLWDLSEFSSPGPTRDGRYKPDITAPGHGIVSTLSQDAAPSRSHIIPDGVHQLMQGTSMAAPHVAGAIALLLEKNPRLTPAQVKDILMRSAWIDGYTGSVWNNGWGYGKLEIDAAIELVDGGLSGTTGQITVGNVNCGLSDWGIIGSMGGADPGFQFPAAGGDDHGYGGSLVLGGWKEDVADSYGDMARAEDDTWRTSANGRLRFISPGLVADQDGSAQFEKMLLTPQGITHARVKQMSYAWSSLPYNQFVILDYEITNLGPLALTDLVIGFLMDWDCQPNSSTNDAGYDADLNLAYMWDRGSSGNPYLGVMLLSQKPASFDIVNNANSVYDYGDLPDDVMFNLMSTAGFMQSIGVGDLATLLAAPKMTLHWNKTTRFSVALVAGSNFADLRQAAARAREKFNALGNGYTELYYDDGTPEGGMYCTTPGERVAVRFTPESYPANVMYTNFYTRQANANLRLNLFDDNGPGGLPGTSLLASPLVVSPQTDTWNHVDLSNANVCISAGDFYVSLEWLSSTGPYLGYDEEFPYRNHSWFFDGLKWTNFTVDGDPWDKRDVMIGVGLARITGIASEQNHSLPLTHALSPNYPNPFNPRTTFQYQLAAPARVEIAIYNLLGQKIQVLLHEMRAPGFYEIQWDGQDQAGLPVASGIYFCVLRTPQCELKQKLVLLR